MEERRGQGVHQRVVAGLERVVEREREVGGKGEGGRRVQRDADGAVRLLRGLGGGQTVEEQEVLVFGFQVVLDRPDDARDLVEIAGAVLESDDVGDLRDLDHRLLGVAGVVAVVDDHRQVRGGGDLTGVVDSPAAGTSTRYGGSRSRPSAPLALAAVAKSLAWAMEPPAPA